MPRASDLLRREWSGPSDRIAVAYLEERGYVLLADLSWQTPPMTMPTDRDRRAAQFLLDEWEYGGIVD